MTEEQTTETPTEETTEEKSGAFFESLTRNNRKIRRDRAVAIAEDAEMIYRRTIEDLTVQIKRMRREQENMLDLSPDNAQSLKPAADFDPIDYVAQDVDLGVKIRNAEIKLEIAQRRFSYLFGGK